MLKIFTSILILIVLGSTGATLCKQKIFRVYRRGGPSLPANKIMSRHNVTSSVVMIGCHTHCRSDTRCVGFNYRTTKNVENCQLTNVTDNNGELNYTGDWILMRNPDAAGLDNSRILGEKKKDLCVAPQPLGMESGEIPDNAITASSFYNFHYKPFYARLRKNGEECTWEPTALGRSNSWLQVDLGKLAIITGIATQGTCYNISEWTNSYSVSYSKDGNNWAYFQESGSVKVFDGNKDCNTIVTHAFENANLARYLRVWPQTWSKYPALRLEYYGCYSKL